MNSLAVVSHDQVSCAQWQRSLWDLGAQRYDYHESRHDIYLCPDGMTLGPDDPVLSLPHVHGLWEIPLDAEWSLWRDGLMVQRGQALFGPLPFALHRRCDLPFEAVTSLAEISIDQVTHARWQRSLWYLDARRSLGWGCRSLALYLATVPQRTGQADALPVPSEAASSRWDQSFSRPLSSPKPTP